MPWRGSGEQQADENTTVSPMRTTADPFACLAQWPVSICRVLPPASCTVTSCFMSSPLSVLFVWFVQEIVRDFPGKVQRGRMDIHVRCREYCAWECSSTLLWSVCRLLADAELLDDLLVGFRIVALQIVKQAAALAHHFEQATA